MIWGYPYFRKPPYRLYCRRNWMPQGGSFGPECRVPRAFLSWLLQCVPKERPGLYSVPCWVSQWHRILYINSRFYPFLRRMFRSRVLNSKSLFKRLKTYISIFFFLILWLWLVRKRVDPTWRFPKIGVPLVLIYFKIGFSIELQLWG